MRATPMYVPSGVMPDYRDFARQCWRYHADATETVLRAPPEMFTLVLGDPVQCDVAVAEANTLRFEFGLAERVIMKALGAETHIIFRDLEGVYRFLSLLAVRATSLSESSEKSAAAQEVARFALSTLGFYWS